MYVCACVCACSHHLRRRKVANGAGCRNRCDTPPSNVVPNPSSSLRSVRMKTLRSGWTTTTSISLVQECISRNTGPYNTAHNTAYRAEHTEQSVYTEQSVKTAACHMPAQHGTTVKYRACCAVLCCALLCAVCVCAVCARTAGWNRRRVRWAFSDGSTTITVK